MGLWDRVEINGEILKKDPTFNHQLWFAAAGGLIAEYNKEVKEEVVTFLDNLERILRVNGIGRIYHSLLPEFRISEYIKYLSFGDRYPPLRNIRQMYWEVAPHHTPKDRVKEIGYHAFNLYGFAMLKQSFPDHDVWDSIKIQRTLEYVLHEEYQNNIDENPYGYPYNPPGFEIPYAAHVFEIDDIDCKDWLSSQIQSHFDFDRNLHSRNTPDPETHAARIYEAARLPDMEIQL